MRLIPAIVLTLLPVTAFANCAAEMRICTFFPAGGDVMFTQPCSFTQCASVDTVFDFFRFADGSFVRVDYTVEHSVMSADLAFLPDPVLLTNETAVNVGRMPTAEDQRGFDATELGEFYTEACDERCDGLVADGFGD